MTLDNACPLADSGRIHCWAWPWWALSDSATSTPLGLVEIGSPGFKTREARSQAVMPMWPGELRLVLFPPK